MKPEKVDRFKAEYRGGRKTSLSALQVNNSINNIERNDLMNKIYDISNNILEGSGRALRLEYHCLDNQLLLQNPLFLLYCAHTPYIFSPSISTTLYCSLPLLHLINRVNSIILPIVL